MKTEDQIYEMIYSLREKYGHQHMVEINTLVWVLDYEKASDDWLGWQDYYHSIVKGAKELDFRMPIFLKWIGKNRKVLDIGVHNGIHTNEFSKNNNVVGVDLASVTQKFHSNYKFPYYIWDVSRDLKLFDNEQFEVIVAGEIIEHLKTPTNLINEAYRVLVPKGTLIISCPYNEYQFQDPLHFNKIDENFIDLLLKDLFIIKEKLILKKEKSILVLAESTKTELLIKLHLEETHYDRMRKLVNGMQFDLVLDLGCGTGHLSNKFTDCAKQVVAIDKNINQILTAKKTFHKVNFEVIDFEFNNLEGKETIDLIIMCDFIYYLTPVSQRRIMQNAYELLKPNGYLLISRHKGSEEHEFKAYARQFKKVKGEWVTTDKDPQKWYIALLQKQNE